VKTTWEMVDREVGEARRMKLAHHWSRGINRSSIVEHDGTQSNRRILEALQAMPVQLRLVYLNIS